LEPQLAVVQVQFEFADPQAVVGSCEGFRVGVTRLVTERLISAIRSERVVLFFASDG
jgi:hypothetical protein